jgi:hypothetical protein
VSAVSDRCGTVPAVPGRRRVSLPLLLVTFAGAACTGTPTAHSAASGTLSSAAVSAALRASSAAERPTHVAASAAAPIAASTGAAAAALAALAVKGRAPMTG